MARGKKLGKSDDRRSKTIILILDRFMIQTLIIENIKRLEVNS